MDTVLIPQDVRQANWPPDESLEAAAAARARAGVFDFLAALLNQRPDLELVRTLRSIRLEALIDQAILSEPDGQVVMGLREMARFVESTAADPEKSVETALGVDWTRLFRGVVPRYGPPPPYESIYADSGATELATIQAVNEFYWRSGALLESCVGNRPDYLGLEFSFLCFLAEEEAAAWEAGEADRARAWWEKSAAFFEQHPGAWAEKFITKALSYARTGFYQGFLYLCLGMLQSMNDLL